MKSSLSAVSNCSLKWRANIYSACHLKLENYTEMFRSLNHQISAFLKADMEILRNLIKTFWSVSIFIRETEIFRVTQGPILTSTLKWPVCKLLNSTAAAIITKESCSIPNTFGNLSQDVHKLVKVAWPLLFFCLNAHAMKFFFTEQYSQQKKNKPDLHYAPMCW